MEKVCWLLANTASLPGTQLSAHRSTGMLRPCLEELWTDWLCQGEGKQVDGRRGLETLS